MPFFIVACSSSQFTTRNEYKLDKIPPREILSTEKACKKEKVNYPKKVRKLKRTKAQEFIFHRENFKLEKRYYSYPDSAEPDTTDEPGPK